MARTQLSERAKTVATAAGWKLQHIQIILLWRRALKVQHKSLKAQHKTEIGRMQEERKEEAKAPAVKSKKGK